MLKLVRSLPAALILVAVVVISGAPESNAATCEVKTMSARKLMDGTIVQEAKTERVPCKPESDTSGSRAGAEDSVAGVPELRWSTRPRDVIPECWDNLSRYLCKDPAAGVGASAPAPATREQAKAVAQEAVQLLKLPLPVPKLDPEPDVNEWDAAVVGFPLWLWADMRQTASVSDTFAGAPMTLSATLDEVVFDMGDGHEVRCAEFSRRTTSTLLAAESPTCGYRYPRPSSGSITITATAYWSVRWSALGFSGTLRASSEDSRSVRVIELQSIIVSRG